MSGAGGRDGIGVRAGDDGEDAEILRRGEGGYNRDAETTGGLGGPGGEVNVQRRIEVLEAKIAELKLLEKKIKEIEKKQSAGAGTVEFVDTKQMRPNILKEGVAFRVWREEFERWAGLKLDGMNEALKWLGGRKEWAQDKMEEELERHGHKETLDEINKQLKIALEAYQPNERKPKDSYSTEARSQRVF